MKHRGHDPELVGTAQKWDRCRTCGEVKKRGAKWLRKCAPKPKPDRYMGE